VTRPTIPLATLALLVLVAFGASLAGEFVWDDRPLIVENRLIRDPGSLGTLLTSSFWHTGDSHDRFRSFFRPLVSASYALDHAVWGLERPLGYHGTNLLLHFLCCWIVYRIAISEELPWKAALAGAALFAVHPVHVESVAWISGRTDLVCAALALASFLAHRRARGPEGTRSWRAASVGLFGAALFAKEMAATLPLLIAADRWLDGRRPGRLRAALTTAAPYLAILVLYLVARHAALGREAAPLYVLGLESHVATGLFVVARYTTLLLAPVGLDAHYPYRPIETLASPLALLGLTMVVMVALAAGRAVRTSGKTAFWIFWTFAALLPVLAFGRYGDVLMADRFLYIPSVGIALLLARGVAAAETSGPWARRILSTATVGIVAAFAFATHVQSGMWKDDLTLFSRMVLTSPDSGMVHCNLGLAYYRLGEYRRAREEFQEAIQVTPSYALAHNNLAAGYEREGRLSDALRSYEAAMRLAPFQVEPRINAASLRVRLGDVARGLELLRKLAESHPRYPPALYAYAEALDRVGRRGEALPFLERTRLVDPFYPHAHYMWGKILAERGRLEEAAQEMRRFLALWTEGGQYAEAARRVIDQAARARRSRSGRGEFR